MDHRFLIQNLQDLGGFSCKTNTIKKRINRLFNKVGIHGNQFSVKSRRMILFKVVKKKEEAVNSIQRERKGCFVHFLTSLISEWVAVTVNESSQ